LQKTREQQIKNHEDTPIRLIYSSRTHAQLKQIIRELRRTVYHPTTIVLGARDHYCIRKECQNLKGNQLNVACGRARKAKDSKLQCSYYFNFNKNFPKIRDKQFTRISDIEELRSQGELNNFCPYYYSMKVKNEVDLIILPYTYLLDLKIALELELKLTKCAIIFDEAHNIESAAEDGYSCEVSTFSLETAIEEVDALYELLKVQSTKSNKDSKETNDFRTSPSDIPLIKRPIQAFLQHFRSIFEEEEERKPQQQKFQPIIKEGREIFNMITEYTKFTEDDLDSLQMKYRSGLNIGNVDEYLAMTLKALTDLMTSSSYLAVDM